MVSDRCKKLLETELNKLGLQSVYIALGEVEINGIITTLQVEKLTAALLESGLELMENKKFAVVKQIKTTIDEMISNQYKLEECRIKERVCRILNCNSAYTSHVFSEVEGQTIKQYILAKKIEYVKDLLLRENLNITEISYRLNYSSVAHLSAQFKKLTGLPPSKYKSVHLESKYLATGW